MDRSTVILITLVVYKLGLIALGVWAQRRTRDAEDFFIGGRALGPVVAAISYSASSSSAWTLLGMSGAAFVMGLSALWLVAGAVGGMVLAFTFVAPRLRALSHQHRLTTLTDLLVLGLRGRAAAALRLISALIIFLAFAFYVAAQFQGAGQTFQDSFGLSMRHSILIGGAIILIYTVLGGFWAVSLTDAVQGVLMALAAILLPVAAWQAVGGWGGFIEGLQSVSTPEQLRLSGRHAGWMALGFVLGSLGVGLGTFGQPHLLVRFMALRDDRALRQARVLTVLWFLVVFGGMAFVGLAGHVLLPELAQPESVFFALTEQLFPPIVAAVLVAAVLSAILSTADSQLLVGASAVAHDLGLNRRHPRHSLWISRAAIAGLVVLAAAVALALPASIFDRALLAWTALGAAFGPLVIFRVAGVRVRPGGVLLAVITGFTLAVFAHFNPGAWVQTLFGPGLPSALIERIGAFAAGLLVLYGLRRRD